MAIRYIRVVCSVCKKWATLQEGAVACTACIYDAATALEEYGEDDLEAFSATYRRRTALEARELSDNAI